MTVSVPTDWYAWHADYDDLVSTSSRRLAEVQERISALLDGAGGRAPISSVVSMAAGQSRDLLPLLIRHPNGRRVRALLVERDPRNADFAEGAVLGAGLTGVEIVTGDAGLSDVYRGIAPAELVLACGVLDHLGAADRARTVDGLARLTAADGAVIWTLQGPATDRAEEIRGAFDAAGFVPERVTAIEPGEFVVVVERRDCPARDLEPHQRLFTWS